MVQLSIFASFDAAASFSVIVSVDSIGENSAEERVMVPRRRHVEDEGELVAVPALNDPSSRPRRSPRIRLRAPWRRCPSSRPTPGGPAGSNRPAQVFCALPASRTPSLSMP